MHPSRLIALAMLLSVPVLAPTNASAATIYEIRDGVSVFANTVNGKSGNFLHQNFTSVTDYITVGEIQSVITDMNPATFAWSPDYHLSPDDGIDTYLDVGFGTDIYNGDGFDLVMFFAGNGTNFRNGTFAPFRFMIDIGADGVTESGLLGVTSSSTTFNAGAFVASYALIDLDVYGFDTYTPLGDIRIHLGDQSMPTLSMVGAYHTSAIFPEPPPPPAVPLPLPALLMVSGLGMLGLLARRR